MQHFDKKNTKPTLLIGNRCLYLWTAGFPIIFISAFMQDRLKKNNVHFL